MTDTTDPIPTYEDEPPRYEHYSSQEALPSVASPRRRGGGGGDEGAETHSRLSVSEESDDSSINENYEVESISSSIADQLTWRGRMQRALHSHWFHYFIIFLVVLDAFIVLFELLLDVGAFGNVECEGEGPIEQQEICHFSRDFRDQCSAPAILILRGEVISTDPSLQPCRCGFRGGKRVCILSADGVSIGVNPALVLHYLSLIILSIFMVEIILKIIAFRMKYFTHKFEVFDGIVVVLSWILDIASLAEEEVFEAANFIILLRLWRVVRIVNGAVLSAKAQSDNQLENARKEGRRIIHALHKAQERVDGLEENNKKLKAYIKSNGLEIPENGKNGNHSKPVTDAEAREE